MYHNNHILKKPHPNKQSQNKQKTHTIIAMPRQKPPNGGGNLSPTPAVLCIFKNTFKTLKKTRPNVKAH